MFRRILSIAAFGLALMLSAPLGFASVAEAGCLSASEARAAVQSGQVIPLSRVLKQIRKAAGGEILPPPQLCDVGGQYVYLVNVLSRDGQVTRLTVDASSGSILGY